MIFIIYIMSPFDFVHSRMWGYNTVEIHVRAFSNGVRIQRAP